VKLKSFQVALVRMRAFGGEDKIVLPPDDQASTTDRADVILGFRRFGLMRNLLAGEVAAVV